MTGFAPTHIETFDPLDIEILPGVKVRDKQTPAECNAAVSMLELHIARIQKQIAKAEADPGSVQPGWRTRAQNAIRWKNRAIRALRDHAANLLRQSDGSRGAKILKVIREEVGEAAFEDYVAMAKRRYPEAFGEDIANG